MKGCAAIGLLALGSIFVHILCISYLHTDFDMSVVLCMEAGQHLCGCVVKSEREREHACRTNMCIKRTRNSI